MTKTSFSNILVLCLIISILSGCRGGKRQIKAEWTTVKSEETKGGGKKLSFVDQQGRTKILERTSSGHVWQEVILQEGQVISDLGWYEDGSKRHEIRSEGDDCVTNVEWYASGQKKREYAYKNGVCVLNLVWYPSGQLSEKNVYDKNGRYLAALRWYPSGQLKYEVVFKDGQVVKRTFYNEDGAVKQTDSGSKGASIQPNAPADADKLRR